MMKIHVLLLSIFIVSISCQAQNFEGEIVYQNEYKSKIPQVPDQQLGLMMGNKQNYFYKDGNYRSEMNGQVIQWQLYINKDNKLYNKMANSETVFWNDASTQTDEVLEVKINKNVIEVLGYQCDEIILTCKTGIQKYYFSSKVAIDASLFKKHKYGNWYDYISQSNALPLKMIIDNSQFTLTSTAVAVTRKTISEDIFILPKGTKTEKNPY